MTTHRAGCAWDLNSTAVTLKSGTASLFIDLLKWPAIRKCLIADNRAIRPWHNKPFIHLQEDIDYRLRPFKWHLLLYYYPLKDWRFFLKFIFNPELSYPWNISLTKWLTDCRWSQLTQPLNPVKRKGKISRQFENFKIYKDLYGKPLNHDPVARPVFPIQIQLISSAVAIVSFEIYGWKSTGCLIFICSFSFCWNHFSKARTVFRLVPSLFSCCAMIFSFLPNALARINIFPGFISDEWVRVCCKRSRECRDRGEIFGRCSGYVNFS